MATNSEGLRSGPEAEEPAVKATSFTFLPDLPSQLNNLQAPLRNRGTPKPDLGNPNFQPCLRGLGLLQETHMDIYVTRVSDLQPGTETPPRIRAEGGRGFVWRIKVDFEKRKYSSTAWKDKRKEGLGM